MITRMSKKPLAILLLAAFSLLACQKVSSTSAPKLEPNAGISSDKIKLLSPVATPEPGFYLGAQLVTLSSATAGATIYYTTDGSTPTRSASIYSNPISVEVSQTIKAFALKSDFLDSDVASFEYRIQGTVVPPSFSVPEGAYGPSQTVTLTSATPGATIYYTIDGSEPTTSSTKYVDQVTVAQSQTIKAIAVFSDWKPSLVSVASYTINGAVAKPTASPAAGVFSSGQSVTLSSETADSVIYYTTDNSDPATSTTRQVYSQAIDASSSVVIKAIATKENFSDSEQAEFKYDIFLPPVISFSTADFKLKAGANAQLTPVSSGGPITTCVVEPELPVGLSVGATDCSISGTPTYGGASVAYIITPKNPGSDGSVANLTITINGEDVSGAFYINGNLVEGYQEANSELGLSAGYYKSGLRHPGLSSLGSGFSMRDNKYYIEGVETPLDQNGNGDFAGRRYVAGQFFTGLDEGVCFVDGVSTSLVSAGKGVCNGTYYLSGLDHPGLDSSGTGYSSRDQKYYVNGSLADGFFDDKTVLLMHMDGHDNLKTFVDSSESGLSFVSTGEAKLVTSHSRFGSASAYFDGSTNSIVSKPSSSFGFAEDFSVEAWIKRTGDGLDSSGSYFAPIASASTSADASGWIFYVHNGSNLGFLATESGGWNTIAYFSAELPLNEWHHVAAVRSSNTVRLYVNGFEIGSAPSSHPIASGSDVYVGSYPAINNSTPASFQGYIDELRITNSLARYTSNFTPPQSAFATVPKGYYKEGVLQPGLDSAGTGINSNNGKYYVNGELANGLIVDDKTVLLMHMDASDGLTRISDSSALNRSVTKNGSPSISSEQSKFGGASLKLPDSYNDYLNVAQGADLSSGSWTVEAWFLSEGDSVGNNFTLLGAGYNQYPNRWVMDVAVFGGNIYPRAINESNERYVDTVANSPTPYTTSTWSHLAWVNNSDGDEFSMYVNGVKVHSGPTFNFSQYDSVQIGQQAPSYGSQSFFLDELRITKGLARYTDNFTPPAEAFPNPYTCYLNGSKSDGLNSEGTGWCPGSNKYYVKGAETGLSQSGDGNFAGRRYVGGLVYNGLDDGVCYVDGMSTNLVVDGQGPCGEKYYIGGIHQPGLDSSGSGQNALDSKYYVNGSIAEGFIDDKTVLLMHMDGGDNSQSFMDSSSNSSAITTQGDSIISSTVSKFGGSSAYFDGSGDFVSVQSDTKFTFGDQDFTVELWFKDLGGGYEKALITTADPNDSEGFWLGLQGNSLYWLFGGSGNWSFAKVTSQIDTSTWHHVAMTRSGNSARLFVDGVLLDSIEDSTLMTNINNSLRIGGRDAWSQYFNGYIDEVRITKGLARYTENFVPPQAAFATVPKGYYKDGVLLPGLDSAGTGTNSLTGKYYVNGSLVNGYLSFPLPNLITSLKLDDSAVPGASNTYLDSSGNGRNGLAQNMLPPTESVPPALVGKLNRCATFNGYDSHISFESLSQLSGASRFSMAAWVKINNSQPAAFFKILNGYGEDILFASSESEIFAQVNNGNDGGGSFSLAGNYSFGTWAHLALVFDGNGSENSDRLKIYLNGQPKVLNFSYDVPQTTPISFQSLVPVIGNYQGPGDWALDGSICEVNITSGALNAAEVSRLANGALGSQFQQGCFLNGVNTNEINSSGNGWCSGSNKYYVMGVETGLSQSGDGNFSGRRYVGGVTYTGFDDGVCYVDGMSTSLVVDGKGPCGEKYYIGGIHQPGLDSSGSGQNALDSKYYVNGTIAEGFIDDKTVLLMHMDEGADNTAFVDSSTFHQSIISFGNAQVRTQDSLAGGSSAHFDGFSYLSVADSTTLAMQTNDFTVEAWANPSQLNYNDDLAAVIDTRPYGGGTGVLIWLDSNSGKWIGYISTNGNSVQLVIESPAPAALDQWTHLALVRFSSTLYFFVNGTLAGTQSLDPSWSFTSASASKVFIGTAADGPGHRRNFYGYIDEVRITNGLARYTSNFTPPQSAFAVVPKGYYIDGVIQPGLDFTGAGFNAVDGNKYYVNGARANSYINGQTILFMEMKGASGSSSFVDSSSAQRAISVGGSNPNLSVTLGTNPTQPGETSAYFPADFGMYASTYLSVPGLDIGANDFKIEMSFYPTTYSNGGGNEDFQALFSGAEDFTYGVMMNSQGFIRMWAGSDSGWNLVDYVGNDALAVTLNAWNEVKLERQGTWFRLYLNGQVVGELDSGSSAPLNWGSGFRVGVWGNGQSPINDGYVDNVKITDTSKAGYYKDGVLLPGLNSNGSGLSSADGKYYVNGQLANGPVDMGNLDFELGSAGWNLTGGMGITNAGPPGGGVTPGGIQGSYFAGCNDESVGSAVSQSFQLPPNIDHLTFLRAGGADSGSGLYVKRVSDDAVLCSSEDGADSDVFFTNTCEGLGDYANTLVYISIEDNQNSGWGKTYVDNIRLQDQDNNDLAVTITRCFTEGNPRACNSGEN